MKRDRRKEIKKANEDRPAKLNGGDKDDLILEKTRRSLVRQYRESGKVARPDELEKYIGVHIGRSGKPDKNYKRNLKIICLYINKVKVEEISRRSNLTVGTIYNILSKYKIKRIPDDRKKAEAYKKAFLVIGRKIEQGKDIKEIAEELNLEEAKVNQFVNKFLSDLYKQKMDETKVEAKNQEESLKVADDGLSEFNVPVGKEVDGELSEEEREKRIKSSAEETRQKQEDKRKEKEEIKKKEEEEKIYRKGTFGEDGIIPEEVDDEEYEVIMKLVGKEDVSLTSTERKILMYLRAALKYSAEEFDMTDYSKDQFLVPDYILPIDIIIMKDINERFNRLGEKSNAIARYHRVDEQLVIDVVNGEVSREEFRKRFFKSLMDIIESIKEQ